MRACETFGSAARQGVWAWRCSGQCGALSRPLLRPSEVGMWWQQVKQVQAVALSASPERF